MISSDFTFSSDYTDWLVSLKRRIHNARQRAVFAANREQIQLYHEIGQEILERQSLNGWGSKVIERLSSDLRQAFPEMKGLSTRNLKYMRVFAQECPNLQIGQHRAAQLPWPRTTLQICRALRSLRQYCHKN